MADPKYPEYNGVLRFDDDNLVEVGLQPDTENITVKLNGTEISGGGGAGLPEVDSSDNGDVLTVVEGEWTNAAPASQLPAVSSSNNGNVLTVVEGAWAAAAVDRQVLIVDLAPVEYDDTYKTAILVTQSTTAEIRKVLEANGLVVCRVNIPNDDSDYTNLIPYNGLYLPLSFSESETEIDWKFIYDRININSSTDLDVCQGQLTFYYSESEPDPEYPDGTWILECTQASANKTSQPIG